MRAVVLGVLLALGAAPAFAQFKPLKPLDETPGGGLPLDNYIDAATTMGYGVGVRTCPKFGYVLDASAWDEAYRRVGAAKHTAALTPTGEGHLFRDLPRRIAVAFKAKPVEECEMARAYVRKTFPDIADRLIRPARTY